MTYVDGFQQITRGKTIARDSHLCGYIYAFRMADTDFVKIGKTTAMLQQRLAELQIATPYLLHPIAAWAVDDRLRTVEKYVHFLLKNHHYRSEWFVLPHFTAQDFIPLVQKAVDNMRRMKRLK